MIRRYENMVLLDPSVDGEQVDAFIEKVREIIQSTGGTFEKADKLGKKTLAYPIKKREQGQYVVFYFTAEEKTLKELGRRYKLMPEVLRYLIVKPETRRR